MIEEMFKVENYHCKQMQMVMGHRDEK